jgi:hypothetical protein
VWGTEVIWKHTANRTSVKGLAAIGHSLQKRIKLLKFTAPISFSKTRKIQKEFDGFLADLKRPVGARSFGKPRKLR